MAHIKEGLSIYFVVVSGLVAVLGSLGFTRFGYSMILPGMKDSLTLNYTQMGLMASGNFCGYMVFAIIAGMLASRYGPRIVISTSLATVGISMLLTGFIQTYSQALVLVSLAGVGSGGANVPAMMLPAVWLPSKRRGLASGVIASGSSIGLITTGFLEPLVDVIALTIRTFNIKNIRTPRSSARQSLSSSVVVRREEELWVYQKVRTHILSAAMAYSSLGEPLHGSMC